MLETFDAPDPSATCGRRLTTTLPTQALTLLNDGFVRNQARRFAERVIEKAGPAADAELLTAYRLALSRDPSLHEIESGQEFLRIALAYRRSSDPARILSGDANCLPGTHPR